MSDRADPTEQSMLYPRIVRVDDRLYLKILVDGRDREMELSPRQAFVLGLDMVIQSEKAAPR